MVPAAPQVVLETGGVTGDSTGNMTSLEHNMSNPEMPLEELLIALLSGPRAIPNQGDGDHDAN